MTSKVFKFERRCLDSKLLLATGGDLFCSCILILATGSEQKVISAIGDSIKIMTSMTIA